MKTHSKQQIDCEQDNQVDHDGQKIDNNLPGVPFPIPQSGLEAINWLAEKYLNCGKRLHLTHLSPECRKLLDKAGDLVQVNVSEDPHYHIATDRLA